MGLYGLLIGVAIGRTSSIVTLLPSPGFCGWEVDDIFWNCDWTAAIALVVVSSIFLVTSYFSSISLALAATLAAASAARSVILCCSSSSLALL